MASRKLKTTSYRKHKTSTPYQRPKGVLQKVKDWLTPSKWTNPWDEEEDDHEDEHGGVAPDHASQSDSHSGAPQDSVTSENVPQSTTRKNDACAEEEEEELDKVTPIPVLTQKGPQTRQEVLFNGIESGSFLQRSSHPTHTGTSPSSSTGPARMFTSTPYVAGPPVNRHIDTPRPTTTSAAAMEHRTKQLSNPAGRPSFSVSTFHSPTRNLTDLSLSRSPFVSPFYSGRVTYGGALNRTNSLFRKRSRQEVSPPRAHVPSHKQVVRPRPPSFADKKLASQTARKILDTLQSMSSPLHDARKLPLRVASPAKRMRLEQQHQAPSSTAKSPPPPVSSLLKSPTPASLSTVRQPVVVPAEKDPPKGIQTITIDLTTTQTNSSPISMGGTILPSPPGIPSSGKMRTVKKHSSHYSSKKNREEREGQGVCLSPVLTNPIPLSIPSSITVLPISLPSPPPSAKTDQSSPALRPSPFFEKSSPPPPPAVPLLSHPKSHATSTPTYSFTSPLPVATKQLIQTTPTKSSDTFEFSDPKIVRNSTLKTTLQFPGLPKPVGKEPLPLKSGSVLDALKLPEYQLENIRKESRSTKNIKTPPTASTSTVPAVNLTDNAKFSQPKTEAKTMTSFGFNTPLLKMNAGSSENGSKSNQLISVSNTAGTSTASVSGSGSGLAIGTSSSIGGTGMSLSSGTGFKPSAGVSQSVSSTSSTGKVTTATSDVLSNCWTSNPPDKTSCVPCGAPKKQEEKKHVLLTKPSLSSLAPPTSNWECPTCMVSNKPDTLSCVACSEKKPGTSLSTGPATGSTKPLLASLAPPTSNWECPTCMISNKPDCQSCLACGEKKPGSSSTGTTDKATPIPLSLGDSGGLKLSDATLFGRKQVGLADLSGKGLKIGSLAQPTSSLTGIGGTSSVISGSGLKLGQPGLQLGSLPSLFTGPQVSAGPGLKLGGGLPLGGEGLKLTQTQTVSSSAEGSMPVVTGVMASTCSFSVSSESKLSSANIGLQKVGDSSLSGLPRLPVLSPLSSKPITTGLSANGNSNISKLPTLTPFSIASSSATTTTTAAAPSAGISISRPNIKSFGSFSFTPVPPPPVSDAPSTTPQSTPRVDLTGTFSKPVQLAPVNTLPVNPSFSIPASINKPSFDFKIPQSGASTQGILTGSKLPFGQQQPIGPVSLAPPLTGLNTVSSTSSVMFSTPAQLTTDGTTRLAKGMNLAFGTESVVAAQRSTTDPLKSNDPMSLVSGSGASTNSSSVSASGSAQATGFNFSQYSATPKLNFGSTNTPSFGGTIFGTQPSVQPPSLGGSGQVFQFGGSQQQSTGPVQFTASKELSFGDGPPANPFLKGREIKKAKRRIK